MGDVELDPLARVSYLSMSNGLPLISIGYYFIADVRDAGPTNALTATPPIESATAKEKNA